MHMSIVLLRVRPYSWTSFTIIWVTIDKILIYSLWSWFCSSWASIFPVWLHVLDLSILDQASWEWCVKTCLIYEKYCVGAKMRVMRKATEDWRSTLFPFIQPPSILRFSQVPRIEPTLYSKKYYHLDLRISTIYWGHLFLASIPWGASRRKWCNESLGSRPEISRRLLIVQNWVEEASLIRKGGRHIIWSVWCMFLSIQRCYAGGGID